jgi:hypothetical protein
LAIKLDQLEALDFAFRHMMRRRRFANTALSIFVSIGYASLLC